MDCPRRRLYPHTLCRQTWTEPCGSSPVKHHAIGRWGCNNARPIPSRLGSFGAPLWPPTPSPHTQVPAIFPRLIISPTAALTHPPARVECSHPTPMYHASPKSPLSLFSITEACSLLAEAAPSWAPCRRFSLQNASSPIPRTQLALRRCLLPYIERTMMQPMPHSAACSDPPHTPPPPLPGCTH